MIPENDDQLWQRLSKALFGARSTTDEGLFTFQVMERIRVLQPELADLAWPRFLRWAVPMLGASVASLIFATRSPAPSASLSMDTALFQQQLPDEDPLSPILDDYR